MLNSRIKSLISLIVISAILLFSNSSNLLAQQNIVAGRFILASCDVSITADESTVTSKGITYTGNVKVLVGFANLKLDKITLVKKKNGKCELVSDD